MMSSSPRARAPAPDGVDHAPGMAMAMASFLRRRQRVPEGCLLAAAAAIAAACTYRHPYPASWPALPVPTVADCRHPPLRIDDAGVEGRAGRRASFYGALFGSNIREARNGHVWIERLDDIVRITYIEPTSAGWEVRKVRDVTDFACEDGRLVLHDTHIVAGAGAAALSAVAFRLAVAPTYVMVEQVERAAGIALVVPIAAEANDWMWFARVD
jgi:hypothetical protein